MDEWGMDGMMMDDGWTTWLGRQDRIRYLEELNEIDGADWMRAFISSLFYIVFLRYNYNTNTNLVIVFNSKQA